MKRRHKTTPLLLLCFTLSFGFLEVHASPHQAGNDNQTLTETTPTETTPKPSHLAETSKTPTNMKQKHITLDVQKVEIRALLQVIADVADVNMVVSNGVKGRMSFKRTDTPWDEVISDIVKEKQLIQSAKHDIIIISTPEEYKTYQQLSHLSDDLVDPKHLERTLENRDAPLILRFLCTTKHGYNIQLTEHDEFIALQYGKLFATEFFLLTSAEKFKNATHASKQTQTFQFRHEGQLLEFSASGLSFENPKTGKKKTQSCDSSQPYINHLSY